MSLLRGWGYNLSSKKDKLKFPEIEKGKGIFIYDYEGKKYYDMKSQMMNVSFGHCNEKFQDVIIEQLNKIEYIPTMDGHGNKNAQDFADKLLSLLPGDFKSVYCTTSGTTSCETAIQIARAYFYHKNLPHKQKIISITGAYHGCSVLMSEISEYSDENIAYRLGDTENYIKTIRPYCYRCPLGLNKEFCRQDCALTLEQQLERIDMSEVCAIIVEMVQGAGVIELPKKFVTVIERYVEKSDILLIVDEVLTGFGRTGWDFAYERYNVEPDIVCLSKAISNGILPLGAIAFNTELTGVIQKNELHIGSTQDGNPLCTLVGKTVLDHYEEFGWAQNTAKLGEYFLNKLRLAIQNYPIVGDIRGIGLMICIELVEDKLNKEPYQNMDALQESLIKKGIFAFLEENWIMFIPPLIITKEEVDSVIERTEEAIKHVLCLE